MPDPPWVTPRVNPNALPAGGSYWGFEVADLLIPSGTDWSSAAHLFGGPVEIPRSHTLIATAYLELDQHPSDTVVRVVVGMDGSATNLSTGVGSGGPLWTHSVDGGSSNNDLSGDPATPDPWFATAVIKTDGALAEDITVIYARAAFLVF